MFLNNIRIPPKAFKALCAYMSFFGSRYISTDIGLMCGNILDHPIVKTFTLFCIMYSATETLETSLIMTILFLLVQYSFSLTKNCKIYIDKSNPQHTVQTDNVVWPYITGRAK